MYESEPEPPIPSCAPILLDPPSPVPPCAPNTGDNKQLFLDVINERIKYKSRFELGHRQCAADNTL
jgi:hypothetical protein